MTSARWRETPMAYKDVIAKLAAQRDMVSVEHQLAAVRALKGRA